MDKVRLPEQGRNNLWYRYNDTDAVLVFVHGVLSDSRGCWLYEDTSNGYSSCYWPELAGSDSRYKGIASYLAGYHTGVDSGDFPIQDCASEVLSYLKTPGAAGRAPVLAKRKITSSVTAWAASSRDSCCARILRVSETSKSASF